MEKTQHPRITLAVDGEEVAATNAVARLTSAPGIQAQFHVGKDLLTLWDRQGNYFTIQSPGEEWAEFVASELCTVVR